MYVSITFLVKAHSAVLLIQYELALGWTVCRPEFGTTVSLISWLAKACW